MLLDIKAGDWYIDDTDAIREAVVSDKDYWARRPNYRKIIAATDKSLRQPTFTPTLLITLLKNRVRLESVRWIIKSSRSILHQLKKMERAHQILLSAVV